MLKQTGILAALALWSGTAVARDFCPERPGQATPPCVVEPGRVVMELGILDWERSQDRDSRSDLFSLGEATLRTGLTDHLEVELDWTAFATERVRDLATDAVSRSSGVGDVTVALKQALGKPDGPVALRLAVTVPVDSGPASGPDWSTSAMLPLQFDLTKGVQIALTPEVDYAPNGNRSGHHATYGSVIGVSFDLAPKLSADLDFKLMRDDDPDGPHTDRTIGFALAWQPAEDVQFDVGGIAGVGETDPTIGLYLGVAKRF